MLLGEYEHSLDDKNRVTLPAKFRQAFADGVFVARGIDPCLLVFPPEGWHRLVEGQMEGLNPFSREARQMSRYLFAGAIETELDKQGRIMLPATLLEHARPRRRRSSSRASAITSSSGRRTPGGKELDDVGRSAEHVAERLAGTAS